MATKTMRITLPGELGDSANENHATAAHRIVAIGSQQGVVVFLSKERGFCFPSSRIDGQGRASPSLIGSLTQ